MFFLYVLKVLCGVHRGEQENKKKVKLLMQAHAFSFIFFSLEGGFEM